MRGGFDGKLVSIEDAELRLGRLKRENALLQRQLGILLAAKAVGDLHNHILERKQRPEPEEYINRMVNELSGAMLQQKRKGKIKSTTRDRSGEQHRNKDDSTEIEDNRNRSKDTSSKRDGHRGRSKDTSSKRDGHRSRSKDTSSKRDGHRSRSKDTSSKRDGHRSRSKDTSSKRDGHRSRSKDTSSKRDGHRSRSKDTSSKRDGHRSRSKDTSSKRDGHRSRSKDTSSKRDGHRSRSKDTSSKRDGHRSRSKDTSSKRDGHRSRSKDTSSKRDGHRSRSKDTSSKRDGHRSRSKDTSSKRDGHRSRSKDTSSKRDGHRSRSKDTSSKRDGHRSRSKDTSSKRDGHRSRSKDTSSKRDGHRSRSKDTSSKRDGHRSRSKDTSSKRDGHRSRSKDTSSKRDGHRSRSKDTSSKRDGHRSRSKDTSSKRDGHRSKHERREEELVEQERSSSSNEIPVRHADDRRVGVADLMGHLKDRMAKVKDNKDVRPLKNDTSKLEGRRRHRSKMTDRPKRHNKGRSKAAEREVAIVEEPQATFRESNEAASHSKLDCDLKSGTEQGTTIVDRLTDIASSLLPSSRYPAQPTAQDMPSNNVPDYGPQQTKEDALKVSSQKASNAVTAPPVARHIERHDLPFMPDLPPFKPGEFTIWKEEQARKAMIRARALALAGNKKGESSSDSD